MDYLKPDTKGAFNISRITAPVIYKNVALMIETQKKKKIFKWFLIPVLFLKLVFLRTNSKGKERCRVTLVLTTIFNSSLLRILEIVHACSNTKAQQLLP